MNAKYWNDRYLNEQTGWDIGGDSRPLSEYIDQVEDKDLKILYPGAGLAWDAEYAFEAGFKNTFVSDLSEDAKKQFHERIPSFPEKQYILGDFFDLEGSFDLIVEQTFFCALDPSLREEYAMKMYDLLNPGGKLAGVLFTFPLDGGPPFGGSESEYRALFGKTFNIKVLEPSTNSIQPRLGNEVFMILEKPRS